ncbi:hypothetical protein ACTMTJ_19855 [Phytohabitans sp. LJ34]|uniref:hypothetical protein n=1 Tax=Phytohabitans sp. LJ34 TaxID=3452217 RepID=UPI003F89C380
MTNPAPSGRPPLAVVSLGLGAVAIPTLFCFGLGIPLGLAAVVTGVVAFARERGRPGGGAGRAAGGVALGLLALAGAAVLVLRPDG